MSEPNFYIVNGCGELFLFQIPEDIDFEEEKSRLEDVKKELNLDESIVDG